MYSPLPIEPQLPEGPFERWLRRPRVAVLGIPVFLLLLGLVFGPPIQDWLASETDPPPRDPDTSEMGGLSTADAGPPDHEKSTGPPTAVEIPPTVEGVASHPDSADQPTRPTPGEPVAAAKVSDRKSARADSTAPVDATPTPDKGRERLFSLDIDRFGSIERITPRDPTDWEHRLVSLPVGTTSSSNSSIEIDETIEVQGTLEAVLDVAFPASPREELRKRGVPNSDAPFVFGKTLRFLVEISARGVAVVRHEELDGAPRRTGEACRRVIEDAEWEPARNEDGEAVDSLKIVACPF